MSERRVTSVLFGDLVGFTALAESRDPEEVRELLSRYFAEARTVVGRYGGTVEKFIGDAVMAVWGVPVAHEDDAERAVRAGLDLVSVVVALGDEVQAPGLTMRVGVVTGEVAVTLAAAGEGMVAGDAVNTAARVQTAATPGAVWVDDATRALTVAAVAYTDAGRHTLKGKAEPVSLFAARTVVASVGGAQRVDGLEAPFTGRERQLRLVKELFHETAEEGRPRLVLLSGMAGVGKSRLAWEFEKYIDGLSDSVAWHRGRCLSYGEGVAFWALAEAVRTRLGLTEGDPASVVEQHLQERLGRYFPDSSERAWAAPRLAVLMGVGGTASYAREDLFAAWTRFFERAGDGDPVIVVLDDVQYADDALLDFVEHLLATSVAPVHLIALTRPELLERRSALPNNRRVTVLHLEPMSSAAMAELIDGLVEGLPTESRDTLVVRADGIPLYAVETVRALIDRDAVIPREGRYVLAADAARRVDLATLGAPASLQALVASRLDALAPAERRLVADASILGASFTRAGLQALADPTVEVRLDEVLAALVQREVLTLQTDRFAADRGQYRFLQAVVRQVAYDTLSRRDRKAGHLAVATHLAAQEDAGDDLAGVIAQHLLDAVDASAPHDADVSELTARAVETLERAALRALSVGSPVEALRHYRAALARSASPQQRTRLREGAARAAMGAGRMAETIEHAQAVITARDPDDPIGAARGAAVAAQAMVANGDLSGARALLEPRWTALVDDPAATEVLLTMAVALSQASHYLGDFPAAQTYVEKQLQLAEALGDSGELVEALTRRAVVWLATGVPTGGLAMLRMAADMARSERLPRQLMAALLNTYAFQYSRDLPAALIVGAEARDVARQAGDASGRSLASANLSAGLLLAGSWTELAAVLDQMVHEPSNPVDEVIRVVLTAWWAHARGLDLGDLQPALDWADSEDLAVRAWVQQAMVMTARQRGDVEAVAAHGAESVRLAIEASGLDDDFPHLWVPGVLAAVEAADLPLAQRLLNHVEKAPAGLHSPLVAAQLCRLRGLVTALAGGNPESDLRIGIDRLAAFGAVPDRLRAQAELGVWLTQAGRSTEAEVLLTAARAGFTDLGAHGWLAALEQRLSSLPV